MWRATCDVFAGQAHRSASDDYAASEALVLQICLHRPKNFQGFQFPPSLPTFSASLLVRRPCCHSFAWLRRWPSLVSAPPVYFWSSVIYRP